MRKEIVEKTYAMFNELNEKQKEAFIKEAHKDEMLVDWYFEYEYEGYQSNLDHLKTKYNVDFDVILQPNSNEIKDLIIKKELDQETKQKLYDDLLDVLNSYGTLFKGEIDYQFVNFITDYYLSTGYEFLIDEKVIENA